MSADPVPLADVVAFHFPPDNVVADFEHKIRDVEVVISCSCGRCYHGETEAFAIEEWEAHARERGPG